MKNQVAKPQGISRYLYRLRRIYYYYMVRLFRIKGNNRKIALGFVVGVVLAFIPTFGFGPWIAPVIARFLRANVVAGVIGGLSGLLWPLLQSFNVLIGNFFADASASGIGHFGRSFLVGMMINSLVIGTALYLLVLWLFNQYRLPILEHYRSKYQPSRMLTGRNYT